MAEAVDARHLEGRSQRLAEAADVTLVVKGTQFPCHSSALAMGCRFFEELLFSDLPGQASMASGPPTRVVLVPEGADDHPLTPENFSLYLQQLYRERVNELLKVEDALLLLPAADFLGATYFLQKCSRSLAEPGGLKARLNLSSSSRPPVDRLLMELDIASRYQLRDLMVALLPHTVELVVEGDMQMSETPLDSAVLKVLTQRLAETIRSGRRAFGSARLAGDCYDYRSKLASWGI